VGSQLTLNLIECFETRDSVIIVLEDYLDDDHEKLEFKMITGCNVLKTTKSILDGFAELSSFNIIHRNICQQNIIVVKNKMDDSIRVLIYNFICSEFKYSKKIIYGKCGEPGYLAPELFMPEQKLNINLIMHSDTFSIGILLFELVTKEKAYVGESIEEVLEANRSSQFDIYRLEKRHFHSLLIELITLLTEHNVSRRININNAKTHSYFDIENAVEIGNSGETRESLPCLQDYIQKNQISQSWRTMSKVEQRIREGVENCIGKVGRTDKKRIDTFLASIASSSNQVQKSDESSSNIFDSNQASKNSIEQCKQDKKPSTFASKGDDLTGFSKSRFANRDQKTLHY